VTARVASRRGAGSRVLGWLLLLALPVALAAQPAGPVDTLTREMLRRTGKRGLAEILQSLLPSFNLPRPSVAGGSDHVRPATLHGMGADQVLVLVNGRRRHPSALLNLDATIGRGQGMVDWDAIPVSAIERIEVLREGDAARYGFGAVSGVINLILLSQGSDLLSAELGSTTEGDAPLLQAGGNHRVRLRGNGFLQLGGELSRRGATNRALPDRRPQYFPNDPRNVDPALNNRIDSRFGDREATGVSGFFNGEQPLLASVSAYAFGGWSRRRSEAGERWRTATDDRTVRAIYPNGFLPLIAPRLQDGSAVAGLRGSVLGLSWDASLGYGRNSVRYQLEHTANASLGTQSPTAFHAGTLRADQFSAELGVSRRIIPGGSLPPLLLELGGIHRSDGYQIQPGEPDSYRPGDVPILDGPRAGALAPIGVQGFTAFRPSNAVTARRGLLGGFGELSTVILERLSLAAAGRLEQYQEFGTLGVYEFSGQLRPVEGLELRAGYGTAARVPSLAQSWYGSDATILFGSFFAEDRFLPSADPMAVVLGIPRLKPEHSRHNRIGGTLSRVKGLSLRADYYRVRVSDRIILSGKFDDASVRNFLAQQGYFGIDGVRFFANALTTLTTGFDAGAEYHLRVGRAQLSLSASLNHNSTQVVLSDSIPGVLEPLGKVLFERSERARYELGQPDDNLILAAQAARGPWTFNARAQRFGGVTSFGAPADGSLDQRYGAKWLGDVSMGYRARGGLTLQLGADNLFNTYPDRNKFGNPGAEGNSNFGMFPYSNLSPFGFNGRLVYLRALWRY
jgi:iron complex outermembrane receptor protein